MDYKSLADHSKVWIYQSNRKLREKEVEEIRSLGAQFINSWATHGRELEAAFEIFEDQFIVLFVDETKVAASGCSIDSSVRFIKQIEEEYNIDCFDRMNIAFEKHGSVQLKKMPDFQQALKSGELNENTVVFNNLINTKKEFIENWKVSLNQSWHKQLL